MTITYTQQIEEENERLREEIRRMDTMYGNILRRTLRVVYTGGVATLQLLPYLLDTTITPEEELALSKMDMATATAPTNQYGTIGYLANTTIYPQFDLSHVTDSTCIYNKTPMSKQ
jgi:hypothetical protein